MPSDVCRLCGLDAKEHRRMESDKRRGFHEFATPIDDEQAAQEICRILGGKGYPFVHNAAIDKVLDLLRSREQAAKREALAERRDCACGEDTFAIATAVRYGRCYNCRQKEEDRVEAAYREGQERMRERAYECAKSYGAQGSASSIRSLPIEDKEER